MMYLCSEKRGLALKTADCCSSAVVTTGQHLEHLAKVRASLHIQSDMLDDIKQSLGTGCQDRNCVLDQA